MTRIIAIVTPAAFTSALVIAHAWLVAQNAGLR